MLRSTSLFVDEQGRAPVQPPPRWSGLPLDLYRSGGQDECGSSHVDCPTLILGLSGCEGRRWHRENGKLIELGGAPGMIDVYGRDYQREWARWELTPGATLGIRLTSQTVGRLLPDLPDFDLATAHGVFDPKLQWLMQELLDEARSGAPSGTTYAESLSCALLARLAQTHGRRKAIEAAPAGGLSAGRRRRVIDFIEAHLGEPLGVVDLAREAMLSPDHFSRSFTVSFGQPPHRYIQQRRVEAALKMLKSSRSISDIALELGFYSHTHFTRIFRQHTGTTPSRMRSSSP